MQTERCSVQRLHTDISIKVKISLHSLPMRYLEETPINIKLYSPLFPTFTIRSWCLLYLYCINTNKHMQREKFCKKFQN